MSKLHWLLLGLGITAAAVAGCIAAALCALFSPFYLAAPMGFLVVHGYRGEQGEENRLVNYLAYPVLLLFVGIAGNLMG